MWLEENQKYHPSTMEQPLGADKVDLHIYIYIYVYIRVYIYIYIYILMCVCIYIYINCVGFCLGFRALFTCRGSGV